MNSVPSSARHARNPRTLGCVRSEFAARSWTRIAPPACSRPRVGEAIARAGGLNDFKADPGGVFLLRFDRGSLVTQFVPNFALPPGGNPVPVIYRLNLHDADWFFLARSFAMKDKDIMYIANSSANSSGWSGWDLRRRLRRAGGRNG